MGGGRGAVEAGGRELGGEGGGREPPSGPGLFQGEGATFSAVLVLARDVSAHVGLLPLATAAAVASFSSLRRVISGTTAPSSCAYISINASSERGRPIGANTREWIWRPAAPERCARLRRNAELVVGG
jgi:hypothetical protein